VAKFLDVLAVLIDKPVTVAIIGVQNSEAYSGTLLAIGDDYIELDGGEGQPRTWIPAAAIASVVATPPAA
jgi:hypothetical protein